ncbi:MAG: universal stress protein [Planctomycetota bacterium]|nr:MAG: universal stress protein [Planctomycetota bacterium]
MIRTILFATDFSELSRRAERHAVELARALRANLEIMHAIEPLAGFESGDEEMEAFTAELRARCEQRMTEVAERVAREQVRVSSYLTIGSPWSAIVERAEAIGADLIVLGSHGLARQGRVYLGTTSHRVLFHTAVPVLIVRDLEEEEQEPAPGQVAVEVIGPGGDEVQPDR